MWSQFFWTYIAGPVAAFLPKRWRSALGLREGVRWGRAGAASGALEVVAGIAGLAYWYMAAMAPMIRAGTDAALEGRYGGTEVTEHQVAGAALVVFATHPITWLLAYLFVEGAVRLFASAFTEDAPASLPFYLVDRAVFLARHGRELELSEGFRRHAGATAERIREKALVARLEEVPDELHPSKVAEEEYLEIRACRKKEDWIAPKTVRVDDVYYRLEDSSVEKGARPFRYRLRRLAAGVPGRTVLLYSSRGTVRKEGAAER